MYINVNNIEQSFDPILLNIVVQLVSEQFPEESPTYFDNGNTYSGISFGKNPNPIKGYEEAGLINVASQKNNISIYFDARLSSGNSLNKYISQFPKNAIGKGCLRIRNKAFLEKNISIIKKFLKEITD